MAINDHLNFKKMMVKDAATNCCFKLKFKFLSEWVSSFDSFSNVIHLFIESFILSSSEGNALCLMDVDKTHCVLLLSSSFAWHVFIKY